MVLTRFPKLQNSNCQYPNWFGQHLWISKMKNVSVLNVMTKTWIFAKLELSMSYWFRQHLWTSRMDNAFILYGFDQNIKIAELELLISHWFGQRLRMSKMENVFILNRFEQNLENANIQCSISRGFWKKMMDWVRLYLHSACLVHWYFKQKMKRHTT